MVEFKLVLADSKTGKSYQREVKEPDSKRFVGLKIGDAVKGELINLTGYEFLLTGGSDYCGFPMRKDVSGSGRKRIMAVSGVGIHQVAKGVRLRKTVCGNTIGTQTVQINLKIMKAGKEPLGGAEGKEVQQSAP